MCRDWYPESAAIATCCTNPDARSIPNRIFADESARRNTMSNPTSVPDCDLGPSAACVAAVFSVCQKDE